VPHRTLSNGRVFEAGRAFNFPTVNLVRNVG
jgi:hypothetical protein